jgi:hypothetical protein
VVASKVEHRVRQPEQIYSTGTLCQRGSHLVYRYATTTEMYHLRTSFFRSVLTYIYGPKLSL